MANCLNCAYANWDKTANGRRHPSGRGKCVVKLPFVVLPAWAAAAKREIDQINLRAERGDGQTIWRDAPHDNCETFHLNGINADS